VPFSSEEKYMRTRHGDRSFLKGAAERVLGFCDLTEAHLEEAQQAARTLAKRGLRVLAFAQAQPGRERAAFLGLLGMEDPPREGMKESLLDAERAGIRTIMITGDSTETARAIADHVGIRGEVMHGMELDSLSPEELRKRVQITGVFARVSPQHKVMILRALQAEGQIVAMSGDGVNDAPALKGAHVGIAMGTITTPPSSRPSARAGASTTTSASSFSCSSGATSTRSSSSRRRFC
jgi:P-type Ca2+ transporter type 2C